jgi:hypothetical protein
MQQSHQGTLAGPAFSDNPQCFIFVEVEGDIVAGYYRTAMGAQVGLKLRPGCGKTAITTAPEAL